MTYEQKARLIVTEAFKDKKDRAGRPYIEHLEAVCRMVESDEDEVKAIALLHDILEDCPEWTVERIVHSFNARIGNALAYLTKGEDDLYVDYVDAIKENRDAVLVKIADLRHNMDVSRLKKLTDKDLGRLRKYHLAYIELTENL